MAADAGQGLRAKRRASSTTPVTAATPMTANARTPSVGNPAGEAGAPVMGVAPLSGEAVAVAVAGDGSTVVVSGVADAVAGDAEGAGVADACGVALGVCPAGSENCTGVGDAGEETVVTSNVAVPDARDGFVAAETVYDLPGVASSCGGVEWMIAWQLVVADAARVDVPQGAPSHVNITVYALHGPGPGNSKVAVIVVLGGPLAGSSESVPVVTAACPLIARRHAVNIASVPARTLAI